MTSLNIIICDFLDTASDNHVTNMRMFFAVKKHENVPVI
jgi:hypothetical protein